MAILDVETLDSPHNPLPLDEHVRVGRRGRRAPAGSNLNLDQAMIRAAYRLTELTGDARYQTAAEQYIVYYLDHFIDPQTKLVEWGWHNFYDAYQDAVEFLEGHSHELHGWMVAWPFMYPVRPDIIRQEIEQIWKWHVHPETGQVGRHPDRGRGCSFTMTAGEFVWAFAFLHSVTQEPEHLEWALKVARRHWSMRNPETDLFANRSEPHETRWDSHHAMTMHTGCWCSRLLAGHEITRNEELRDLALAVLRAWAKYGWDERENMPWGILRLDGTALEEPRVAIEDLTDEVQMWQGHAELWRVYSLGFEYPLESGVAYLMAFDATGDDWYLKEALRWGECYRRSMPPCEGKGTYAENYGKALSFFTQIAFRTGDASWLDAAQRLAKETIERMWTGRIFRGHPDKPYYEAADGVGFLVSGLLDVHEALENTQGNLDGWNL